MLRSERARWSEEARVVFLMFLWEMHHVMSVDSGRISLRKEVIGFSEVV